MSLPVWSHVPFGGSASRRGYGSRRGGVCLQERRDMSPGEEGVGELLVLAFWLKLVFCYSLLLKGGFLL